MLIHWFLGEDDATITEGTPPPIGMEVSVRDARCGYSDKRWRVKSVIHQIWRSSVECRDIAAMNRGSAEANLAAFQEEHKCCVDHLDMASGMANTAKQECEVVLEPVEE